MKHYLKNNSTENLDIIGIIVQPGEYIQIYDTEDLLSNKIIQTQQEIQGIINDSVSNNTIQYLQDTELKTLNDLCSFVSNINLNQLKYIVEIKSDGLFRVLDTNTGKIWKTQMIAE